MLLALPLTHEEGLQCVSKQHRQRIVQGKVELVAIAHGQMVEPKEKPRTVQFILLYGTFDDEDDPGYYLFDTVGGEFEVDVLINGDGSHNLKTDVLPQSEALAKWMAGFLGWNEKVPGLYRLRYAVIEKALPQGIAQTDASGDSLGS